MFENPIHTLTLEDSEEEPFIVTEKVQKLTGIKLQSKQEDWDLAN